jgi:hypothetical protein
VQQLDAGDLGKRPSDAVGVTDGGTITTRSISAGGAHTCRLKSDPTIECWGENSAGQSMPPSGTRRSGSGSGVG